MAEDHYTPSQAARILARSGRPVSERRIRQLLQAGEIEGLQSDTGRWRIPRRVVHRLLEESPRSDSGSSDVAPQKKGESPAEASENIRELLERVEGLSYRLGAAESRLQLTESAESSVREERDRLRAELEQERAERRRLQERLESSPADIQSGEPAPTEPRPLWKRIISEITGNR